MVASVSNTAVGVLAMSGMSLAAVFQSITGTRSHILFVDHGIVYCPRRGDIEFDACMDCPELRRLNETDGLTIECSGERYTSPDPTVLGWVRPFDAS